MSIVLNHVVGHIVHAILSKLLCSIEFCHFGLVLSLNFHVQVLGNLFLDKLPLELVGCVLKVLFHLLLVSIFVGSHQITLQKSFWQLQVAHFFAKHTLCVHSEAVVAVVFELVANHLFHLLKICLFVLGHIFAQNVIKELLVHFSRLAYENFSNSLLEVTLHVSSFVFVNVEQRSQFCGAFAHSLCRIEHDFVIHLFADEFLLFVFIFQIFWRQNGLLHVDTTFFGITVFVKFHH